MDRTWRVNFTSPDAIQAGYNDDLEFVLKELGKTYLAVWSGWNLWKHLQRHYLDIFRDSCAHCHGAGTVTCPHCSGFKIKRTRPDGFASATLAGGKYELDPAVHDQYECHHCGTYTTWDQQEKWPMLTAVKEVVSEVESACFTENERFTEDKTEDENSKEFDPEQYITGEGDTDFAGWYTGDENGEVHPKRLRFSEWVLNHPEYYDRLSEEQESEAINANIAAAVSARPKPEFFPPTAGTVPCPCCHGARWFWGLAPNISKLGGYRAPFWITTLQKMAPNWNLDRMPVLPAEPAMEYPLKPRSAPRLLQDPLPGGFPAGVDGSLPFSLDGPKAVERRTAIHYQLENFDKLSDKMSPEERQAYKAALMREIEPGQGEDDHTDLFHDPLSDNPEKVLSTDTLINWEYNKDPLTGKNKGMLRWLFGPYTRKQEAARIRDLRMLEEATTPEEREEIKRYMSRRLRWQGRLPGVPSVEEIIPPSKVAGTSRM